MEIDINTPSNNPAQVTGHCPVLLNEVVHYAQPNKNKKYLDCTFGCGGYTKALLKHGANVEAIDRDPNTGQYVQSIVAEYPNNYFSFTVACFDNIANLFKDQKFDGIIFDLGVSSLQLDDAKRGFSFLGDGPLDMRMGKNSITAAEIVNTFSEKDLADIIYKYGEEKFSRRIARTIVKVRTKSAFDSTVQLANLIRAVVPNKYGQIDSATRTFQALRIYVNDELNQLEQALEQSVKLLKPTGRIIVVSFHSLEDRLAKVFMNKYGKYKANNKYLPEITTDALIFNILTKKPVMASEAEINNNVRSRSAKMRAAELKIGEAQND